VATPQQLETSPAPRPARALGFDEEGDATRRTRLANERTYLAWWRSGLTALAVALAVGKIVPQFSGGASWPWAILGGLYGGLAIAFIAYGYLRLRAIDAAIRRGDFSLPDTRFIAVLTGYGILLAALTIIVVAANG
jgi:putative membrane protein